MQPDHTIIFNRPDTFLGVCEGLGQDFGFNPLPLRIVLGVAILWNPVIIVGAYVAVALLLAAARRMFPIRTAAAERTVKPVSVPEATPIAVRTEESVPAYALAA